MKFRVWDKLTSSMQYTGFRLTQGGEVCIADTLPAFYLEPGSYEIMCSTSIKDKDGTELYQGDVVAQDTGERDLAVSLVDKEWINEFLWYSGFSAIPRETLKVLGNRWQNPELLEKSGE